LNCDEGIKKRERKHGRSPAKNKKTFHTIRLVQKGKALKKGKGRTSHSSHAHMQNPLIHNEQECRGKTKNHYETCGYPAGNEELKMY